MNLRHAGTGEYKSVREFYWETIDLLQGRSDTVAWKKGIYPSDEFLKESIGRGELYVLEHDGAISASVILNSAPNDGYAGLPWSVECASDEVLIPHALAVHPVLHKKGLGGIVVKDVIEIAESLGKKTVRLDILEGNAAAERLYTGAGFQYVGAKNMYYEDTGWREFRMYELIL